MDKPKASNLRRFAIISVVFILLSIVLMFWARDVIREVVVLPLSYLFYVINIFVDYTPQIFFWIVLLLIGLRIAFLSISRKKKQEQDFGPYYRTPDDDTALTRGRVAFWVNKVDLIRSSSSVYYTYTFHDALSKTLLQLLAYRYRLTARQVEDGLRDGSLVLPPEIRDYALCSLEPIESNKGGIFGAIWEWISTTIRNGFHRLAAGFRNTPGTAHAPEAQEDHPERGAASDCSENRIDLRGARDEPRVLRVLKFMEEELEVLNDDTGR